MVFTIGMIVVAAALGLLASRLAIQPAGDADGEGKDSEGPSISSLLERIELLAALFIGFVLVEASGS